MAEKRTFNQPIHAFRGFAILNIVIIHAFGFVFFLAGSMETPATAALKVLDWANSILFHDATLYFAAISGILFSLILQERGYARFFKSKFSYVFMPYLCITALYSWRQWTFGGELIYFEGTVLEFLVLVGENLVTGGAIFTLWYIPVLMVLYIATPVLASLLATDRAKWLNVAIMMSPLVISRVWPDISWTNYAYFIGAYMLGMHTGANYHQTISVVKRFAGLFAVTAIVTTAILVLLFAMEDPQWGIIRFTESAWYLQKIAISGLVLLWFERSVTTVPKWLDVLGNYAFAIYFLHGYLLFEFYIVLLQADVVLETVPAIVFWAVTTYVAVIVASVVITFVIKTLLGRKSRYFVGV